MIEPCWYELDLPSEHALNPAWKFPDTEGKDFGVWSYKAGDIFNPPWLLDLAGRGIRIAEALVFYRDGGHNTDNAHLDIHRHHPVQISTYGFNLIIGGQDAHMTWYRTPVINHKPTHFLSHYNTALIPWLTTKNLKLNTDPACCNGDWALLLHSEKHSDQLDLYRESGFVPVYWWSHAIIARDWFRYAEHDPVLKTKHIHRDFLIYNRAWQGTREYRLGFADRLIRSGMENDCLMRVSAVDSTLDKHYDLHKFEHPEWRPTNVIENYFPECTAESHYSADFDIVDYRNSIIEVVLETLYDDSRQHLTEKILRPIAMGKPFILASTPGSLQYLRDYGFETFSTVFDESYDNILDPVDRLKAIVKIMQEIVELSNDKILQLQEIARRNRDYFFSDKFFNEVIDVANALDKNKIELLTKSLKEIP